MKKMTFSEKKEAWWEWHNANPAVWDYFEKFSLDAVRRGTKKISHWLIINRIRWEVYIVTTGDDFKISNDFIAFYARLWKLRYPQHKELFNTKRMLGEYSIGEYVNDRAEETQARHQTSDEDGNGSEARTSEGVLDITRGTNPSC